MRRDWTDDEDEDACDVGRADRAPARGDLTPKQLAARLEQIRDLKKPRGQALPQPKLGIV